jgi:hypothetical protein
MADITMCNDDECPKKEYCYRFTAKPNPYRQSYFTYSPKQMDGCPEYLCNEEAEKRDY